MPLVYQKQRRRGIDGASVAKEAADFLETGFTKLKTFITSAERVSRDIFSDLSHGSITCGVCTTIVILAQSLLSSNMSDELIMDSANNLCTSLNIETPRVCHGIVAEFAPEVLTVIKQLVITPEELCGRMFDDCGTPYDPLNDWNVTFPDTPQPPPVPPTPPKEGSPTLRVLHLTDVHFDRDYKPGSNAKCGEPLCCREGVGSFADPADGAWTFGDYRSCDTPLWTLENMFATLAQNHTFDLIYWTGDVPAHNVWNQSRADQIDTINYVVSLILKYFPGKPVYPSLGNHESSPVNSFPPPYITGEHSISWLYDELATSWKHWLPQDAVESIKRGAYYTVSPYQGLRIISLNMNYCNNENWWMLLNTTDPTGELQWLIATLQKAEDIEEKVHILGHIPPGENDCLKAWSWNYYKIVSRYQNTIAGQFFGHTHKDEFEVFYDIENLQTPVGVAYIGPSVTPYTYVNMGFRFYTVDGDYGNSSYQVLDHETFYMNLTKAHIEGKITWEFEYSAKAAYNLPSIYPKDWDNLINTMTKNDTVLQQYYKFYKKSAETDRCTGDCRTSLLCQTRSGRSHDPSLCKDFFKREEDYENMLRRKPKSC
ncbi:hypothetical protein BsWGS_24125 [Bradybaena similaris]